ncbi:hypothetical protein [Actinomadura roseirufa]|uniref:hypothetical protein n=1 Tax=Actinomadura roseirufa TaxID=2094049 RepID=UPI001040F065|nr:hypothetical protein [Actinomadura roseirufa]
MFHSDIMHSIMRERARELRAEGAAARDARTARRAREFWAERAERAAARLARRPGASRPGAVAPTRSTSNAARVH